MMFRKLLFCVVLVTVLMTAGARAGQWRVLTEENPPFNGLRDGQPHGFAVDVVREILQRLGRSESIEVLPWARGYHLLETDPDVFLFATMRTRQREDRFHWIGPLQVVEWGLYARKDNPKRIRSLQEARSVSRIGATRKTAEEQYLKSLNFGNLERSNSFEANLRKLLAGRVDLWLHFEPGLTELFEKVGIQRDKVRREVVIGKRYLYIAASRKTSPETVTRWREAFQDMIEDGTLSRLRFRWFGPVPRLPLRLMTEEAPPSSYPVGDDVSGYSVAVVREILRRLQVTADVELATWSRGYQLMLNGEEDMALFAMSRIPQREKLFKWVGPLYSQNWGFYARHDSGIEINSLEQAAAVPRIGTYSDDAKELYLRANGFSNLVQSQNNITAIRRLLAGQLDLWVSSDFKVPSLLARAGVEPQELKQVLSFKSVDDYIGFSRSTPDSVINAWQDVLDDMRSDGTLDFLLQRYRQGVRTGR
jgi:polar amino acid transport system substrate-binding protein